MMRERNRTVLAMLICSVLLFSCASPPPQADPVPIDKKSKPNINVTALEKQIHALINKERQKSGLPLLAWDNALADIAGKYSRDMAKRNFFAHYSPEGHDFSKRYQQAGYQCAVRTGRTIHMGAENIALNHLYDKVMIIGRYKYYDWNSQDKLAETTVQGWMKSPGHRENILTPYFKSEGIGIFINTSDTDGRVYITQNFC